MLWGREKRANMSPVMQREDVTPVKRLDRGQGVCIWCPRMHVAVANGARGLDAEEEAPPVARWIEIGDAVGIEPVEQGKQPD